MPGLEGVGKLLMLAGLSIAALGLLIFIGAKYGVGRLPGDIFIQKGNFRFYFPLVSSILLSILLTVLFNLINRR